MEPQVQSQVRYNNYSPSLKEHLKEWEARKDIKPGESLVFEWIGDGDTTLTAYKGTREADEMMDATRSKALGIQCAVNGESIIDPGTSDTIPIMYFQGVYSPNRKKEIIRFEAARGADLAACRLTVNPAKNPNLYKYLVFSDFLEDNANPSQVEPGSGYAYRLLRPEEIVETGWEDRLALAEAMQKIAVATRATLLSIAPKLNIAHPEGITDGKLRENFAVYAEKNKGYLKVTTSLDADETKFTQQVEKAIELSVVAVDADKAMWVFTSTQAVICPASPTQSTSKQLVDFLLLEQGQTTYKQLLALIGKAETNKRK